MSSGLMDQDETRDAAVTAGDNGGGGGPRRTGLWDAFVAYLRSIKHSPRIESY